LKTIILLKNRLKLSKLSAVARGGKAPRGAGCVSQSGDSNGPVRCLQRGVVQAMTTEERSAVYRRG